MGLMPGLIRVIKLAALLQELLNKEGITFKVLVESEECTVEDIVQEVKARNHKLLSL